jgi:hypothetical protein
MDKLRSAIPEFSMPTLEGSKKYLGELADPLIAYAKQNPYKSTAGGVLGLAGAGYGAKKLYDYLTEEEEPAPLTTQEQMLALAKQYGPQAAAALAATGALYGGYRALKSKDRD